jgi:hypothetical protein
VTAGELTAAGGAAASAAVERREAGETAPEGIGAEGTAPATNGPDRQALDGPFTTRQLLRIDEALRVADTSTGLTFSVYVGDLDEPTRPYAEKLHAQLTDPARSVLLAVCPNRRALEIVTGSLARRRLPDRDCKLAALSMTAAFSGGDLAGGIVAGVAQLANHGRA